jgi:hypothetical protein
MNEPLGARDAVRQPVHAVRRHAARQPPVVVDAAPGDVAEPLYERFATRSGRRRVFGAANVESVNDGPSRCCRSLACGAMPAESLFVPRFAAEPPQNAVPSGLGPQAARGVLRRVPGDQGRSRARDPGDLTFYPDRTYLGRTYVPITAPTEPGLTVRLCLRRPDGEDPATSTTRPTTPETASAHPEWAIDLCDEVIGGWRGDGGDVVAITLVWGRPMVDGAALATAQLGDVVVDQSVIEDGRFTLVAPDDYRGQTLDIRLFGAADDELACESLYDDEDDSDSERGGRQLGSPTRSRAVAHDL